MTSAFLHYKSSRVHYSYSSIAGKPVVCFHGYGESEAEFHFLEEYLPASYMLIAIDLPLHGKTEWNEGLDFSGADLLIITESILKDCSVSQPITLLAYSMGGRVALQLLQQKAAGSTEQPFGSTKVEKVILLAPDGLKMNAWYWLATQTWIGNGFFRFTMKHPQWFFLLLKLCNRIGIVNQSVLKFVNYYIDDPGVRQQLYERWTCMRHIKPGLVAIKKIITLNKIHIFLVYGEYDRIIRHERGEKFRRGIESFCRLRVIQTGHQVLKEKNAALLAELILA